MYAVDVVDEVDVLDKVDLVVEVGVVGVVDKVDVIDAVDVVVEVGVVDAIDVVDIVDVALLLSFSVIILVTYTDTATVDTSAVKESKDNRVIFIFEERTCSYCLVEVGDPLILKKQSRQCLQYLIIMLFITCMICGWV